MAAMANEVSDEYRAHRLWESAQAAEEAAKSKSPLEASDRERIKRVLAQVALARSLSTTSYYLLPSGWRDMAESAASAFAEIARQLNAWDDKGAMAYPTIQQLNVSGDTVLNVFRSWPPTVAVQRARQVVEVAQAFEEAASAELDGLRKRLGELSAAMGERATEVAGLTNTINAQQASLDAGISSIKGVLSEISERGDAMFAQKVQELEDRAQATLRDIDSKGDRAKTLITLIGGAGVSEGYTAYADRERRAAFGWSLAAVVLGVGAVLWVALMLWEIRGQSDLSPTTVGLKAGVAVTALTVAGYMTRLGAHHRGQAVKARFRALDMLALGPFSEDLDETQKRELKYKVGMEVFGQSEESGEAATLLPKKTPAKS